MINDEHLRLCLVTNTHGFSLEEYLKFLKLAIKGGITMVQYRNKNASWDNNLLWASEIKNLLKSHNIPLLVNDSLELAREIDAAGVHLGQTDTPAHLAREILGARKCIGLSIETIAELNAANELDCIDYVAASAVFNTKSKANCKTIWGIAGLKKIVKISKHPVIAIGGINQLNTRAVLDAGAAGIAVIGVIHQAKDVLSTTRIIRSNYDS